MKIDGEWYCDECGEKLVMKWGLDLAYGQCICENCWTINDITEGFSSKAEIRWGLGINEDLDDKMFIMLVCSRHHINTSPPHLT